MRITTHVFGQSLQDIHQVALVSQTKRELHRHLTNQCVKWAVGWIVLFRKLQILFDAHPILMSERSGWKRFQMLFLVQLAYWLILLHQEGHLSWSDIFNIHHHCTPPTVCWNNGDICILIKLSQGSSIFSCVVTGVGCGLQWFRFGQSFLSQGCSAVWFCAADQLGPNGMDSDLRSWLVQNQTYIH